MATDYRHICGMQYRLYKGFQNRISLLCSYSESFSLRDNESYCGRDCLDEKQIRQLERAVTGYFDYIEDLIERENVFTMEEFEKSVNAFLEFRQYKILKDNGRMSHKQALDKAYGEYEIFNKSQPRESDFDRMIKKVMEKNQG